MSNYIFDTEAKTVEHTQFPRFKAKYHFDGRDIRYTDFQVLSEIAPKHFTMTMAKLAAEIGDAFVAQGLHKK